MAFLMTTLLIVAAMILSTAASQSCGPGKYLKVNPLDQNEASCKSCPEYTFSDKTDNKTECTPCIKVNYYSAYYRVLHPCNETNDAIIKCTKNHCKNSHFPDQPCLPCKNTTLATVASSTQSPQRCKVEEFKDANSPFTFRSVDGCHERESYVCDFDNTTVACIPCGRCQNDDAASDTNNVLLLIVLLVVAAVVVVLGIVVLACVVWRRYFKDNVEEHADEHEIKKLNHDVHKDTKV